MPKKTLRVGFDLDGVLLYNPARIARPLIAFVKRYLLKKKTTSFYIPKSPAGKFMWNVFHLSSIFPASGIGALREYIRDNNIEAYIITARYGFLEHDFKKWVKRIDPDHVFRDYYYNKNNKQPYAFKKEMIDKLDLDVFVEDNWDIVRILKPKTNAKIFWITNILDHNVYHKYKFNGLEGVLKKLKSMT